ncbi:filamentous hemagglutinin N-terminal domain-containing protein [Tolypothrix sp. PCC 7910]|uniref:two-partner secretion domain-containing protein n=1 Tax=Tolypothrix sp. PCC 7910 TaxID=2099387 RepID=UPI001427802F|nr:filamentous hemagglutinin N-terminal domain-containing protein [Tolypothrix sp. PCC 7910]QIR40036.1 filamentous hemagglutinin N-terminal domain-containing protein [Tolypothrix sp. PCC 7910]
MSQIILGKSTNKQYQFIQITTLWAVKNYKSYLFLYILCALCGSFFVDGIINQAIGEITPNSGDTNTVINQTDNTINIEGGTKTGSNLFHSFDKFGLNKGQIANFTSDSSIQNIFGRVTSGEASIINGLIQVTGGKSNLFLMNPAGIIFGSSASLNVPAAFTATTANGIRLNNQWLNAVGTNNYSNFTGNPDAFAFTQSGGGIINNSNLIVASGQNLTLLGGTVISTGRIEAAGGLVNISAVQGEKLVQISQEGNLLSLGLPVDTKSAINPLPFTPLSLPALLTGGGLKLAATVAVDPSGNVKLKDSESIQVGETRINPSDLKVDANGILRYVDSDAPVGNGNIAIEPLGINVNNGEVKAFNSNTQIQNGDVLVTSLYGKNATLAADNNFIFEPGLFFNELTTSSDLNIIAQNRVKISDAIDDPQNTIKRVVQVGGNLKIQGNQAIDIEFSSKPDSILQTGRDLSLISDGKIIGNARFATGGDFSILNLSGGTGNLTFGTSNGTPSYPIISSNGDVNLGNYTGPSLKVEARGSIFAENITINDKNSSLQGTDPDISVLASSPSLILRAGLHQLRNSPNDSSETPATSPGSITVNGDINMKLPDEQNRNFGPVILSAKGDINVKGNIADQNLSSGDRGSPVILNSSQGNITVGDIKAGNPMLVSEGNITAKNILGGAILSQTFEQNSNIGFLFSRTGNIVLDTIFIRSGSIDISAGGIFQAKEAIATDSQFSGPSNVPVSVLAARHINIQHGNNNFEQGIGVERDQSGNPIYRLVEKDQSGNPIYKPGGRQVFFRGYSFSSDPDVLFRDKNGNLVVVPKPDGQSDSTVFGSNQAVFVDENEQFVSYRPITVNTVEFNPSTNASYTRGLIILQQGQNAQLTGVYQDTRLGSSNGISVVTAPPVVTNPVVTNPVVTNPVVTNPNSGTNSPSSNNNGVAGSVDTQSQLINQNSPNGPCQAINQSLNLGQKLKQPRGISRDIPDLGTANTCEGSTEGNILRIIPDNRIQPMPINLNPVSQLEINRSQKIDF